MNNKKVLAHWQLNAFALKMFWIFYNKMPN